MKTFSWEFENLNDLSLEVSLSNAFAGLVFVFPCKDVLLFAFLNSLDVVLAAIW